MVGGSRPRRGPPDLLPCHATTYCSCTTRCAPTWRPWTPARKQRLREKLEFLQEGLWDAGVRVKKLRGSGRAVFEARLSRGDRILFTLGEPPDGERRTGMAPA